MQVIQNIFYRISIFTDEVLYFIRSYHPAKIKLQILFTYTRINFNYILLNRFLKLKDESIFGIKVSFFDYKAFHYLFREIFFRNIYYFRTDNKCPIIFDCGANIGMATLYFKYLYPESTIYAFEPDPQTFELLKKNIKQNNLQNIHLYNLALSDKKGKIDFYINTQVLGEARMSILNHKFMNNRIKVESSLLSEFIGNKHVDFLKIDIEGAEIKVLNEISINKKIQRVSEMIVEYHHNIVGSDAKLSILLKLLEENKYNYRIDTGSLLIYQRHIFQDILIYSYKQNDTL